MLYKNKMQERRQLQTDDAIIIASIYRGKLIPQSNISYLMNVNISSCCNFLKAESVLENGGQYKKYNSCMDYNNTLRM